MLYSPAAAYPLGDQEHRDGRRIRSSTRSLAINQVQVDEKSKKTFAAILRAMLRQDPDVDDDRRDPRLRDGADRVPRFDHRPPRALDGPHERRPVRRSRALVDLGLQPYMVASSLTGVVSMRLVRTLCPKCKDPVRPDRRASSGSSGSMRGKDADLDAPPPDRMRALQRDRLSAGRIGVFEILDVTDPIRRLITSGAPESMIRSAALEAGMVPIGQDGMAQGSVRARRASRSCSGWSTARRSAPGSARRATKRSPPSSSTVPHCGNAADACLPTSASGASIRTGPSAPDAGASPRARFGTDRRRCASANR